MGAVPFFSIILPTYNRARLLPRAVRSVLAQIDPSWELIVVDDGSTDGTQRLLHDWITTDPRIRMISHSHRGLARSRSAGIATASGNYITFLDSDDEYAPEHLLLRREVLESRRDVELLHGGVKIIGDEYVADTFNPSRKIHLNECVIGGTFVIAHPLVTRLGGWPIASYGDDSAFHQLAVDAGAVIASINTPTYIYYRGEEDSLCAIVERSGIAGVEKFQGGE